jgi:hypothetical protein
MNPLPRFKTYLSGKTTNESPVEWLIDFEEKKLYSETKGGGLTLAIPSKRKERTFAGLRKSLDEAEAMAADPSSPFVRHAMTEETYMNMTLDLSRYKRQLNS